MLSSTSAELALHVSRFSRPCQTTVGFWWKIYLIDGMRKENMLSLSYRCNFSSKLSLYNPECRFFDHHSAFLPRKVHRHDTRLFLSIFCALEQNFLVVRGSDRFNKAIPNIDYSWRRSCLLYLLSETGYTSSGSAACESSVVLPESSQLHSFVEAVSAGGVCFLVSQVRRCVLC